MLRCVMRFRNLLNNKIAKLRAEQKAISERFALYPKGSLSYAMLNLEFELQDLKISILKAFLPDDKKSD